MFPNGVWRSGSDLSNAKVRRGSLSDSSYEAKKTGHRFLIQLDLNSKNHYYPDQMGGHVAATSDHLEQLPSGE